MGNTSRELWVLEVDGEVVYKTDSEEDMVRQRVKEMKSRGHGSIIRGELSLDGETVYRDGTTYSIRKIRV